MVIETLLVRSFGLRSLKFGRLKSRADYVGQERRYLFLPPNLLILG
jgi:hypothetical protein